VLESPTQHPMMISRKPRHKICPNLQCLRVLTSPLSHETELSIPLTLCSLHSHRVLPHRSLSHLSPARSLIRTMMSVYAQPQPRLLNSVSLFPTTPPPRWRLLYRWGRRGGPPVRRAGAGGGGYRWEQRVSPPFPPTDTIQSCPPSISGTLLVVPIIARPSDPWGGAEVKPTVALRSL
jgi:hypothetical protein